MRARIVLLRTVAVVGAWLPFLGFWVFFFVAYGGESLREALPWGILAIGSAAVLGVAVWFFCAENPFPSSVRPSFYAKQLAAAFAYAGLWIAAEYAADAIVRGKSFLQIVQHSPILGWQFLMGMWLYGVVAGVSYAVQTQRRASENERRALRAEQALVQARLEALRSRLNPHFLFNALHTVGALVRQDAARAENAVEKLGDMLRYTLRDDAGETVPFREEWEFTRRYLDFEKLRYAERLDVAPDIDPRSFECRTPTFALQTLVENAVRHSIASRVEGGRVEISARVEGGAFVLRVRDDGGGARESRNGRSGYGLRSLRERLQAVYGDAAGLDVSDQGDSGFEVSLRIPCAAPPTEEGGDA